MTRHSPATSMTALMYSLLREQAAQVTRCSEVILTRNSSNNKRKNDMRGHEEKRREIYLLLFARKQAPALGVASCLHECYA